MAGKKGSRGRKGTDTTKKTKKAEAPENTLQKVDKVIKEGHSELQTLLALLKDTELSEASRLRLNRFKEGLIDEITELEALHNSWIISMGDNNMSHLDSKFDKLRILKDPFKNIVSRELMAVHKERERELAKRKEKIEQRLCYLTIEARDRIGDWVLALPDSFVEVPTIKLRMSGHEGCFDEIMDLKKQLLVAWREKLDLHKENQRLQGLLDRRQSLLDEQQIQIDELLERPIRAPKPDTAERYKYEEEGGLLASERSLNIRHVYGSDPEPATTTVTTTTNSQYRSPAGRVAKRRHRKKENVRSKRAQERLAAASSFQLEISDLEDSKEVRELTDRFGKQSLHEAVVPASAPVAPAATAATTETAMKMTTETGSSNADRVILPPPKRKKSSAKTDPQGSSLVRPLPDTAIGQRTKSNVGDPLRCRPVGKEAERE
ncbi:hypothetical protein Dda_6590 [Drechslerella dactyloides]|uniref:Uncharacterized protein n=1 Tax=Drechslerella dactyloides TaxID=74499 RepID=A0AAD6IU79_DREDA|nr:hypothetical protein Dda_6590 [Drechslerella dactyloides]